MKRVLQTALTAVACIGLLTSAAEAAYKQEYKLSVVPSATSGWGLSASYFADVVKEKTNGRINIKVYPGAQLMAGKQTSELLLVRNGAIDFSLASTINWSPQLKQLNLFSLPFFVANNPDRYKAMDAIESGESGKMIVAAVEKAGVKFIGWAENGFRELTTSKGPINKPDDMKGMKLRVVGTPIFIDIFSALGANPQAINWAEAVTGFEQGIVDGQENPTNGINIPLQIWTWHKFHTDWHYMNDPLLLTANIKIWNEFSKEDQAILFECAKAAEKYSKALSRLGFDDGSAAEFLKGINKLPEMHDPYGTMESHNMNIVKFTPDQIAQFYAATQGVRDKWTKEIGADLVSAAENDMKTAQ